MGGKRRRYTQNLAPKAGVLTTVGKVNFALFITASQVPDQPIKLSEPSWRPKDNGRNENETNSYVVPSLCCPEMWTSSVQYFDPGIFVRLLLCSPTHAAEEEVSPSLVRAPLLSPLASKRSLKLSVLGQI
jgi:hypothetical protein